MEELTPMRTLWPFIQWGLDIIGPFLTAVRQLKFLVVSIDYFTKWVEAKALASITRGICKASYGRTLFAGTVYLEY